MSCRKYISALTLKGKLKLITKKSNKTCYAEEQLNQLRAIKSKLKQN